MAGIFFEGGTSCSLTVNAQCNPNVTAECEPLYYPPRCNVGVNPLQMNAMISELVNAINVVNVGTALSPYDCTRLDNLARVIANIRNICNQPAVSAVLDESDRVAGCFDSKSGTVTLGELLEWITEGIAKICELTSVGDALVERDAVAIAACVAGEEHSLTGFQIGNLGFGGRGYRHYDMINPVRKRFNSVWYQNTTPLGIEVNVTCGDDAGLWYSFTGPNQNPILINGTQGDGQPLSAVIPPGDWYAIIGAGSYRWSELRLIGTEND